jgi:phenylacetate-CoA ligase
VIRSPRGQLIHGEFFTHLFYDAPGIRRFQVRQTRLDRLEIRVVADGAFTPEARQILDRHIHHADRAFQIEWIPVAEIPAGPSGKFRFTISDLSGDAPRA